MDGGAVSSHFSIRCMPQLVVNTIKYFKGVRAGKRPVTHAVLYSSVNSDTVTSSARNQQLIIYYHFWGIVNVFTVQRGF